VGAAINTSRLTGAAIPTVWTHRRTQDSAQPSCVSVASAARVPRRAPSHAGSPASRSAATASAAGARIPHSSLASHNRPRKNFLVITRALWNGFLGRRFSTPDALPVTPALPIALLSAGGRGPVALLRLHPRPGPRRLPARLAAIPLPRPSWPKALLTSFEQTQSRPRSAHQLSSRAVRLIFGMACSTLGRAQGRSLLPEVLPGGDCTPLRGAADLRINTRSTTLSQRSDARGLASRAFSFSPPAAVAAASHHPSHHRLP
jgi:hypothetical protein